MEEEERKMLVEELESLFKQGKKLGIALERFHAKELDMRDIMEYYIWLLENKDEGAQKTLIGSIRRGLVG